MASTAIGSAVGDLVAVERHVRSERGAFPLVIGGGGRGVLPEQPEESRLLAVFAAWTRRVVGGASASRRTRRV